VFWGRGVVIVFRLRFEVVHRVRSWRLPRIRRSGLLRRRGSDHSRFPHLV